jgi:Cu(I)/Ag(I) efflux system membrane fusion protein
LTPSDAARIGVTYATAERAALGGEIRSVGFVTSDETRVTTIAPKIDGYVEQLFVAYTGQSVAAGTPLLRIYSPMLVTAQEELLLAKKLSADVSRASTTTSDATRDAESLLSSARRRLRNWDIPDEDIARIERTGEVTKTLTLRSPVNGVVIQKNVLGGQRIMAGDAVYQVADLREVWVEGEVFERDLPMVRLGLNVVVDFAAMPGRPRQGRIVFVAPILSTDTRTVKIRVALKNSDLVLKPGMYATIRIAASARTAVLQVPRSAVLVTGERTLVFVKGTDGTLTARSVELGQATDERIEILRGLTEGETVVASATFLVDAESNLGSAIGAMGNMPGMDAASPKKGGTAPNAPSPPSTVTPKGPAPSAKPDSMASMPGMNVPLRKP